MEYHHSYTVEIISDMTEKVSAVIQKGLSSMTADRSDHLGRLLSKIADLESRGFIKRQRYYAPTTADFERSLACTNKVQEKQ